MTIKVFANVSADCHCQLVSVVFDIAIPSYIPLHSLKNASYTRGCARACVYTCTYV